MNDTPNELTPVQELDPEAPGGYRLEESPGYWLHRLYRTMERDFQRRLAPLHLTPQEWAVLKTTGRGDQTPASIAQELEMNSSAVTRFLDRLEQKDLLRRGTHPVDRRRTSLELTDGGKRMVCEAAQEAIEINRQILGAFDETEGKQFMSFLQRSVEHLRKLGF
ncbi:MAG: MarR family transcriptional regulator [Acidobacteriota bacterium]|nr:MarR family transcriptional regulator [Acidobacteriota bacterium]